MDSSLLPPCEACPSAARSVSQCDTPELGHKTSKVKLSNLTDRARAEETHHRCPLHRGSAGSRSGCMLLSRHEPYLARLLWDMLQRGLSAESHSVRNALLDLRQKLLAEDPMLSRGAFSNVLRLADVSANRVFSVCLGRLRAGCKLTFREFLQGLCPCACPARLDVYEELALGAWEKERDFVRQVKEWQQNSRRHWKKPLLSAKAQANLEAQFHALDVDKDGHLSIEDLMVGAEVSWEVAREMIETHDLDGNGTLQCSEFVRMFCPESQRLTLNSDFESLMSHKFEAVVQNWSGGRGGGSPSQREPEAIFRSLDDDGDGVVTLHELLNHVDERTAVSLMQAYDNDKNGSLSLDEFLCMLQPERFL